MNSYVLIGGAGAPNFGDELIVKGWKNFFVENNIPGKFIFYENLEKNSHNMHYELFEKQNIIFSDGLVKVAKAVAKKDFWLQIIRGFNFLKNDGFSKYKEFNLASLLEADTIHLHGGGYLNSYDPEKGFYIGLLAALKEHYPLKRIFATGIGFGPFNEVPKDLIVDLDKIFSYFNFFELRDIHGYQFLSKRFSSARFLFGLDDCYLFKSKDLIDKYSSDNHIKRLYLSLIKYNVASFPESFWENILKKSKEFDEVVFFESYPWQDLDVINYTKKYIPNVKVLSVYDSLKHGIAISKNDFVITSRFHIHFIFARLGVNGIYLQDSQYYSIKHASIIHRGSNLKLYDAEKSDIFMPNNTLNMKFYDESYVMHKNITAKYIYMPSLLGVSLPLS